MQTLQPDGTHATTATYDMVGRETGMTDPDRGTESYTYDPNGNVLQSTDARGSAGTVYSGYDGLNRQLWRNTTNSPTGAYVTYTYDGTVPNGFTCGGIATGTNAIGHVTTEQALSGPSNTFTYTACSAYDGRGQLTATYNTINTNVVTGQTGFSYDDAGTLTQVTYPNGDQEQYAYSAQEQLTAITGYNSTTGQSQLLVSGITYNGPAGAPDSYTLGGTSSTCSAANSSIACVTLGYDGDLRLTSATDSHPTTSTPITYYSLGITYDAVGNVTSVSAALPAAGTQSGGQDNQQFCYDDLYRLTWAGTSGTNPCTGQAVSGSTLTNASYTASYQYDASNRITQSTLAGVLASAPQGSYTYDSTHIHAVDAISSSGYEAQYDASGNMTCRTTTSAKVCTSSSQTGAKFTYDVEGRLIEWDSADGTTRVTFGYTGEGARFLQQVVTNGQTTSTTFYLPNYEVLAVPGKQAVVTTYFVFNGMLLAEDQGGHWYYFLIDGLGSVDVVVDATGVIAAQLFAPYGQGRWAGGMMPTSHAFTGQRADSSTGLDYYGARYYDPVAGVFTSADTVGGINRYAYVADNPETLTDPTGHRIVGGGGSAELPPPCPVGVEICNGSGVDAGYAPCPTGVEICQPEPQSDNAGGQVPWPCGIYGQASCSTGGSDVTACKGKAHCVIIVDGGNPSDGTNGIQSDIKAWAWWIQKIFDMFDGDVGFILFETPGADSQGGADLIHQTLQTLAQADYNGNITLVGQSAGAASVFEYLGAEDSNQYTGDRQINSFVAMEASNPAFTTGGDTFAHLGWARYLGLAADYVRSHHINGLYTWNAFDPESGDVNDRGGFAGPFLAPWHTVENWDPTNPIGSPSPSSAHNHLQQYGCDYCMDYIS